MTKLTFHWLFVNTKRLDFLFTQHTVKAKNMLLPLHAEGSNVGCQHSSYELFLIFNIKTGKKFNKT